MKTKSELRVELMYYRYVETLVHAFAHEAQSIIDVGSSEIPLLDKFNWIPKKYCLDKNHVYQSEGVTSILADFFEYEPQEKFDFCTCLQVLEHIPDAGKFAKKLFDISHHVLISVPYQWEPGIVKGHVHDPVDKEKLFNWTGRKPTYEIIVNEPLFDTHKRLICYYAPEGFEVDWKKAQYRGLSKDHVSKQD